MISLQPACVARDFADVALQGGDVGAWQQGRQEQIAVAFHAGGEGGAVADQIG